MGRLRSFVGLAEYFHSHTRDFSKFARPLHTALRGYERKKHFGKKIDWTEELKEAYYALQQAIGQCPLLHFPDPEGEIFLETDASDYGIGAYLYQKDQTGSDKPNAFMSKSLSGAELNWSTPEKEAYAIFMA